MAGIQQHTSSVAAYSREEPSFFCGDLEVPDGGAGEVRHGVSAQWDLSHRLWAAGVLWYALGMCVCQRAQVVCLCTCLSQPHVRAVHILPVVAPPCPISP